MSWLDEASVDWTAQDGAQSLLRILTSAYKSEDDCRYVAATVGLDLARLDSHTSLFHLWRGAIELAAAMGALKKLVDYVVTDPLILGYRDELLSTLASARQQDGAKRHLHFLDDDAPLDWARSETNEFLRCITWLYPSPSRLEMVMDYLALPTEYVNWNQAMRYVAKDFVEVAHREKKFVHVIRHMLITDNMYGALEPLCALLIGAAEGRHLLVELLGGREDGIDTVARALAVDPSAKQALYGLLEHPRLQLRLGAVKALGADSNEWARIRPLLEDPSPSVRIMAASSLAKDAETRSSLMEMLHDDDARVRAAIAALVADVDAARPQLRKLLRDPSAHVRRVALQSLTGDENTESTRIALIADVDPGVQLAAINSLEHCERATEALWKPFTDGTAEIRIAAANTLASIPSCREDLLRALTTNLSALDRSTIDLIRDDPRAVPVLRLCLERGDLEQAALRALAAAGDSDVLEDQGGKLAEASGDELHTAIQTLAWSEGDREKLYPFLEDFDEELRRITFTALIEGGDATAIRMAQFESNEFTRAMAVEALAKRPDTTSMVRKFLHDSHPSVRQSAITALASDGESREILRQLVADPHPDVRIQVIRALTGDRDSVSAIRERFTDEDCRVRVAARFSLLASGERLPDIDIADAPG